jgi:hypothetical protein
MESFGRSRATEEENENESVRNIATLLVESQPEVAFRQGQEIYLYSPAS